MNDTIHFWLLVTLTVIAVPLIAYHLAYGDRIHATPTTDKNYACIYWVNDYKTVEARIDRHHEETGVKAKALTELHTNTIYAHRPVTERDLQTLGHEFAHVYWGQWHK